MITFIKAILEPICGAAIICGFLLCTNSREVPPAAAIAANFHVLQVPPQDSATKGEVLLLKVVPAMRKDAEKRDDAAYAKIQAKMARLEREALALRADTANLNSRLHRTEDYVVQLLTKDHPEPNEYDPCPADTVVIDHYYKKQLLSKRYREIAKP